MKRFWLVILMVLAMAGVAWGQGGVTPSRSFAPFLKLGRTTPGTTTDTLYNPGGVLTYNGSAVTLGTGAGTVFQPPPSITYVLDADLVAGAYTPVIPAGGAEIRIKLGANASTTPGISSAVTINAPTGATPVDGQLMLIEMYDNGSLFDFTYASAFTPDGVTMTSNKIASNGVLNKNVVATFRFNKAANKWQCRGINYE